MNLILRNTGRLFSHNFNNLRQKKIEGFFCRVLKCGKTDQTFTGRFTRLYTLIHCPEKLNHLTLTIEEAYQRRDNGEEIQFLKFIRYFNVFNIADIEGITFEIPEVVLNPNEKILKCENIIEQMPNPPTLNRIDGNRAFYAPKFDFVNMPAIEQFETAEDYYATYLHELTHATGHASRLAREEVMNHQTFGSVAYSREELVAEMGASFLCSSVQIDYDHIVENNAAYLAGWLNVLKEDSRFIFKAAAEAQKAVDYILS